MDNASDYGSEDSRFDSWLARCPYIFRRKGEKKLSLYFLQIDNNNKKIISKFFKFFQVNHLIWFLTIRGTCHTEQFRLFFKSEWMLKVWVDA